MADRAQFDFKEFKEAMHYTTLAVKSNSTLPILNNLSFNFDDSGFCIVTGTNLELEIRYKLEHKGEKVSDFSVDAKNIKNTIFALDKSTKSCSVSINGSAAKFNLGKKRSSLGVLPPESMPITQDAEYKSTLTFTEKEDIKQIKKLLTFAAKNDVRYYLNGVLIEARDGKATVVATDGHRLAKHDLPCEVSGEDVSVIIPNEAIDPMVKCAESGAKLNIGDRAFNMSDEVLSFTSKVIDGKFPDYNRVIPRSNDKHVLFDKEELKTAIKFVAAIFTGKKELGGIVFSVSGNECTLTATNTAKDTQDTPIPIQYEGSDFEIGFNHKYVLDMLANIEGDTVTFQFKDQNSSALIVEGDSEYVLMPMRI